MKDSGHSLREKRLHWHWVVEAQRPSHARADVFIEYYGRTARFEHIGLDGYKPSVTARRQYSGQLYAVFSGKEGGPLIPLTPDDLYRLASTLECLKIGYPHREEIQARLLPEIAQAYNDLKIHQATFARLNPQGAHYFAKFNAA